MCNTHKDQFWMRSAIELAARAETEKEVPVGALLVLYGKVIGQGWNKSIAHNDPTAHAEIIALREGGMKLKNYRLLKTVLYVTLEPCLMCIGALIHARVSRVVFGARVLKSGVLGGSLLLTPEWDKMTNHRITVTPDILSDECSKQIKNFFRYRRMTHKTEGMILRS